MGCELLFIYYLVYHISCLRDVWHPLSGNPSDIRFVVTFSGTSINRPIGSLDDGFFWVLTCFNHFNPCNSWWRYVKIMIFCRLSQQNQSKSSKFVQGAGRWCAPPIACVALRQSPDSRRPPRSGPGAAGWLRCPRMDCDIYDWYIYIVYTCVYIISDLYIHRIYIYIYNYNGWCNHIHIIINQQRLWTLLRWIPSPSHGRFFKWSGEIRDTQQTWPAVNPQFFLFKPVESPFWIILAGPIPHFPCLKSPSLREKNPKILRKESLPETPPLLVPELQDLTTHSIQVVS